MATMGSQEFKNGRAKATCDKEEEAMMMMTLEAAIETEQKRQISGAVAEPPEPSSSSGGIRSCDDKRQCRRRRQQQQRLRYDKYLSLIMMVAIYLSILFRSHEDDGSGWDAADSHDDYELSISKNDAAAAAAAAADARYHHRHRRLSKKGSKEKHTDYSKFSCDDLYLHTTKSDKSAQCLYATTCNDGDGIFAPIVYCSSKYTSRSLMLLLSIPLGFFLIILFRILGSTAEEFFSPGLEMFSIKLGLPERFAGVTLLALGNGAPDVASTVNAIQNDYKKGYLLALGELTGAAMVASTVIVGVVAYISTKPVPCRGAFVRDVIMFIITMILVYVSFNDATINPLEIRLFIGLYLAYVLIVLVADIVTHHNRRAVVEHRMEQDETAEAAGIEVEEKKQLLKQHPNETTALNNNNKTRVAPSSSAPGSFRSMESNDSSHIRRKEGWTRRMMEAISNYDEIPEEDWEQVTDNNNDEDEDAEQQQQGGVGPAASAAALADGRNHRQHQQQHRHHSERDLMVASGWGEPDEDGSEPLIVFHPHHGGVVNLKHMDSNGVADEEEAQQHNWLEVRQEFKDYFVRFWDETYYSPQYNIIDKVLMTLELPFTILRMFTIPVPCDGYYCRPLLALSVVLSPFWICYYLMDQFDFDIIEQPVVVIIVAFAVPLLIGLLVLRFAPQGDIPPRPLASVMITLIGFCVSATWLDLIADRLVNLMSFFGLICRVPSSIMGLTVLAWGNSSQDLIANMTVARKDLSTMAITASFAGPVFNILIGLGIGFSILNATKPGKDIPVHLDGPLRIGFLFSVLNGVLMIVSGICFGKGFIPQKYFYVAMVVYTIYVVVSITI